MRGVLATPSSRLARGASLLSAAVVSVAPIGCKCGTEPVARGKAASAAPGAVSAPSAAPAAVREALLWDFGTPAEPTLLSLWPADSAAPRPATPGVKTTNDQGAAVVVVEGTNPHVEWAFKPPLRAGLFSLEVESTKVAELDVSWRSKDCAAAVDACSATELLGIGREFVEFVLPGTEINALRITFPEEVGMRLVIHRMRLLAKPKATSGWRSGEPSAEVLLTPQGMQIVSPKQDPSIVLQVAGLETSTVGSVELDVGTGDFAPQLFWQGTNCPHFSEDCSVHLKPDGGPGRFAASFAGNAHWTGRVEGLRLDPGDPPGAYVVKRLALKRKAQPAGGPSAP